MLLSRRHTRQSKPSNLRAEPLGNGRGVQVERLRVRPNPTAHRVSEGLGIPRRVASQQSPRPLPQAGRIVGAFFEARQHFPPIRESPLRGPRRGSSEPFPTIRLSVFPCFCIIALPCLGFVPTRFGGCGWALWGLEGGSGGSNQPFEGRPFELQG